VVLFATGAPIAGLAYESGTQKGTTDAKGTFSYVDGTPVRFSIGTTVLGTPAGADVISPYQIAGSATCEDTDALRSLVALLEALDDDANVADGIVLPASPPASPSLPSPDVALRTFIGAFDAEAWTTIGADAFSSGDSIVRGQGIATDGTSWFFSGTTGLEKTDASFASATKNVLAIPIPLAIAGSDHIGDIDYWSGTIYAPVEDKGYKAPKVVLYDPSSLGAGTVFDVPQSLQTGGVPWIAVDGPRGVAYMAEWDPTPELHVFTLAAMAYARAIPLFVPPLAPLAPLPPLAPLAPAGPPIGRVQGGKVYKGQLYLSTDDAAKDIYKVHLASGTVIPLFAIGADIEEEGIAFFARPDGSLMHTLDVTSSRTSSEVRHHKITREPLRWKVCP
jgi:hypothetical protein